MRAAAEAVELESERAEFGGDSEAQPAPEPAESRAQLGPPRPRLIVSVGVSGHRGGAPGVDPGELERGIDRVLAAIQTAVLNLHESDRTREGESVYDAREPALRVISPLAEGADRLVARRALERGFGLECPLPFTRAEYSKDFPHSVAEFDELIARADSVLELDGSRELEHHADSARAAYLETGRMVLRNCDILIAIWDGKPARDVGGTAQIVQEARREGIPVAWINAQDPRCIQVSIGQRRWSEGLDDLDDLVRRIAYGGEPNEDVDDPIGWQGYFRERERFPSFGLFWLLFRSLIGRSLAPWRKLRGDPVARIAREERERLDRWGDIPEIVKRRLDPLLEQYAWASQVATQYGNRHRGAIVLSGFLTILAVAIALFGGLLTTRDLHEWFVLAEIVVLFMLFCTVLFARRGSWHVKWLNYRVLAEQLRQSSFLFLLGRATPPFGAEEHPDPAEGRHSWIVALIRSVTRLAGIPPVVLSDAYLASIVKHMLEDWVEDQIGYHQRTAEEFGRLAACAERILLGIFVVTFGAGIAYLAEYVLSAEHVLSQPSELQEHCVTILTAGLPALSAGLMSVLFHAEIERVAERSRSMLTCLRRQRDALVHVAPGIPPAFEGSLRSVDVARVADAASLLMMHDVTDWRVMLSSRSLHVG